MIDCTTESSSYKNPDFSKVADCIRRFVAGLIDTIESPFG